MKKIEQHCWTMFMGKNENIRTGAISRHILSFGIKSNAVWFGIQSGALLWEAISFGFQFGALWYIWTILHDHFWSHLETDIWPSPSSVTRQPSFVNRHRPPLTGYPSLVIRHRLYPSPAIYHRVTFTHTSDSEIPAHEAKLALHDFHVFVQGLQLLTTSSFSWH